MSGLRRRIFQATMGAAGAKSAESTLAERVLNATGGGAVPPPVAPVTTVAERIANATTATPTAPAPTGIDVAKTMGRTALKVGKVGLRIARRAAPLAAIDLAAHAAGALRDQKNFSVPQVQNRGGFWDSVAKEIIGKTPFIPNAVGGTAAGLGAAAGSLATGTYPNGSPATGLHRIGAAADAFGNAYTQTNAQEAQTPQAPTQAPMQVPGQVPTQAPGQVPTLPPDVAAVNPQTGLRGAPSGVVTGGGKTIYYSPNSAREAQLAKQYPNGQAMQYNPSQNTVPASAFTTPPPLSPQNAAIKTQNDALLTSEGFSPAAYHLSQQMGIPIKEATQLLVQTYQTHKIAEAKRVVKGLTPVQAANMKVTLAKLGMSAAQIKQNMMIQRNTALRGNLTFRNNQAIQSGKNITTALNNNPTVKAPELRAYLAGTQGPHTPQKIQQAVNEIGLEQTILGGSYRGQLPLRWPLTEGLHPTSLPIGSSIMARYVGRSGTFASGSDNLVFELPGQNGVMQKYQIDFNNLSPFQQAYVQSQLATLHRLHPKQFPSANWRDYKRVAMNG